jgi:glutaconate CoA-transferase subunit B
MTPEYSRDELIEVAAARMLGDRGIVFAGVGTALRASLLAQRTHAPRLTIVVEGGIVGPEVLDGELPISTNEVRAARRAMALPAITDLFCWAQRGFFDYGFLGAAQIDPYGNLNTSLLGEDAGRPRVRLPGSGGANDIASLCHEIMVVTVHERRRFVERLDFLTSPGYLQGGESRAQAGLPGRPTAVITDLALMGFDGSSRRLRVEALQPGADLDQVREQTGFVLEVAAPLGRLRPPTAAELCQLRALSGGAG